MKSANKLILICGLLISVCLTLTDRALAQDEAPLKLKLAKNYGYNDFSGRIQGLFTLSVEGPPDLARVIFLVDGQTFGEVQQEPFKLGFNTDNYPLGVHTLSARGFTADGSKLLSNEIRKEFISAGQGSGAALKIVFPILGLVLGIMLISALISIRTGRKKLQQLPAGAPRSYGYAGGAICPKCRRPFGMHFWGFNLLVGKYDRCPYCGRWSLVSRASPEALHAAEQAELQGEPTHMPGPSEAERLLREIEESRYQTDDQ